MDFFSVICITFNRLLGFPSCFHYSALVHFSKSNGDHIELSKLHTKILHNIDLNDKLTGRWQPKCPQILKRHNIRYLLIQMAI